MGGAGVTKSIGGLVPIHRGVFTCALTYFVYIVIHGYQHFCARVSVGVYRVESRGQVAIVCKLDSIVMKNLFVCVTNVIPTHSIKRHFVSQHMPIKNLENPFSTAKIRIDAPVNKKAKTRLLKPSSEC